MSDSKDHSFSFQLNTSTGDSVSKELNDDYNSKPLEKDIQIRLHKIMSDFFSNQSMHAAEEVRKLLSESNHLGAFNTLIEAEQKGLFWGKLDTALLQVYLEIDNSLLSDEQYYNYVRYLVILAKKTVRYDLAFDKLKEIKTSQRKITEPLFTTVTLSLANAAAQLGKKEMAYKIYSDLIKNPELDAIDRAWVYSGLSGLNDLKDPLTKNHLFTAADFFLEGGDRLKAADCYAKIASIIENENIEYAVLLIDNAINMLDSEDAIEKSMLAGLYFRKALYLDRIRKYTDALITIKSSVKIRESLIGVEYELVATYSLAKSIAKRANDVDFEKYCNDGIQKTDQHITDPDYSLQKSVEDYLNTGDIDPKSIEVIENGNNNHLKFSLYLASATIKKIDSLEKIELLDKAKSILDNSRFPASMEWSTLCITYAKVYLDMNEKDDAIRWYHKALEFDSFNYTARQNYAALLWEKKEWVTLEEFFKAQIELFGLYPNMSYGYGRALLGNKKYGEAAYYLNYANERVDADVDKYLKEALTHSKIIQPSISTDIISPTLNGFKIEFENVLTEFKSFIQSEKRMEFWKRDGSKHKWSNSPEQLAKNLYHSFIKGRFSDSIEMIEEIAAGAGKIDIYIRLKNQLQIVVELKMCGSPGYSLNYANEGVGQLKHYMQNKKTHLGYLLIFDGRKKDFGSGIPSMVVEDSRIIFVHFIDLAPTVK